MFVNIGNAWPFHAAFLRMIQRIPSVVILHDMAIQELCFDAVKNGLFPRDTYDASMAHWHGQAGLQKAKDVLEGRRKLGDLAQEIPGFEVTLPCAVSAVTHTSIARDAIAATGTVPAYLLDLPFRLSTKTPQIIRSGIGPLRFVQFGYTGPNRRLQQVLEALAPLKQKIDFRLDIMGSVWDPSYIRRRIDELGLSEHVRLHGFVNESDLDQKLREAHLVFNLRYPTMGEASGSQLRIWNAAAPSVVTNLGWYATLPSNTVFKIEQDEEIPALQALVRKIYANPAVGRAVGAAGRARLEERHTPSHYVKAVLDVVTRFSADAAAATRAQRLKGVMPADSALKRWS
ncbi:glycosyltransferase [Roseovarius dicentrarchi]|uniref:glycosyltransferase n=1 Tax=Roseovarius dicentrarchi TaxID=2250573 RepID=UPI001EF15E06|nr:glycosyltransferase [Roseovarius dicentrarchi]